MGEVNEFNYVQMKVYFRVSLIRKLCNGEIYHIWKGYCISFKSTCDTYNKKYKPQALPEPHTFGVTPLYSPLIPSCLQI